MLLSLPTANRISSWIQHLPGIQKGTSPARALPRLVDVRNGAALTAPAGRLFTRNPALSGTFASGTQLRSQLQKLGNLGTGVTPVSRRIASLNAHPHAVERHAICLPKCEPTRPPPRASELHPKALLQQAGLALPPHGPLVGTQGRAHVDTDALAALQPSAARAFSLIETVNPACYNPLFVRMDVHEAIAVDDDFGDAALLTDLEQLASECRFLREETEIRGVVPDLGAPRLHDAILAGEPGIVSRPADLLQHLLEQELKMYQAALESGEPSRTAPATLDSEPASRFRTPTGQFNALLAEIRNFKRSAPATEHQPSSVASPVTSPTALVFENALRTMVSVHGESNLSGASDGESDVDASARDGGGVTDSEWDD